MDAVQRADDWRLKCTALRVPWHDTELQCTFSAGVATYPIHGLGIPDLLKASGEALYAAKQNGRNQACPLVEDAGQSAGIPVLSTGA